MVTVKMLPREGSFKGTYLAFLVLHADIFWSIWIFSCHFLAHKTGFNSAFTAHTSVENTCPAATQQWKLSRLLSFSPVCVVSPMRTISRTHTRSLTKVEKSIQPHKQRVFDVPASDAPLCSKSPVPHEVPAPPHRVAQPARLFPPAHNSRAAALKLFSWNHLCVGVFVIVLTHKVNRYVLQSGALLVPYSSSIGMLAMHHPCFFCL